ncbi:MAG: histidinol dehydrogenase, partial [Proteobacteria bacterium]|nr:histidinol dehydrogenase [Pseudomonadota bacterium]
MINIKRLKTTDADFKQRLDQILAFEGAQDDSIDNVVNNILKDVKARGDAAVLEYTNRFDRLSAKSMAELEIPKSAL